MSLINRITEDVWKLRHRVIRKGEDPPEITVYLGMNQRHELFSDFSHQTYMSLRRHGEAYPEDPQIAGAKIYFVTKADHYNIVQTHSTCEP